MAKIVKLTNNNTTVYPQTVADAVAMPGRTITTAITSVENDLANFKATKGVAGGIAALDSAGRLPSEYLNDYVYVSGVNDIESIIESFSTISQKSGTLAEYPVVYVSSTNGFFFKITDSTTGEISYSSAWADEADVAKYGEHSGTGLVVPVTGKIYIDKTENKCYRYDGTTLVPLVMVGGGLALGSGNADAYPGSQGVALKAEVDRINETLGPYTDRESIALTPTTTGYVVDSNGAKVSKSGWAMAEFVAEKGNVYLFKPGATDGNVSVFAESITSVETRAVDYTYTYNEDGSIATAQATYNGKTHTYTYAYDAGGAVTITEVGVGVVDALPMTYTTTVGSYSPLVRLNADAELPKDGYCRYMSHFKGNSAIKVVVSYKVDSADLTMRVTRDGVLASISTQLGNLSQKEDETRGLLDKMSESYVEVRMLKDQNVVVDGKTLTIPARVKTKIYPMRSLSLYIGYVENFLQYFDASHWDTSQVTSLGNLFYSMKNPHLGKVDCGGWDVSNVKDMSNLFRNCTSVSVLDVSGWDTGNVTNMGQMFYGCSSVSVLDVSGWDTKNVTNMGSMFSGCSSVSVLDVSGWDTKNVTNMGSMFSGCSSVSVLDVSGWDTKNVTNMAQMFSGCSSVSVLDVSGWDTKNVTSMVQMFSGCSSVSVLDVSGFDTGNVTSMYEMFFGCSSVKTLDVSGWDTKNVTNMGYMFFGCSSVKTLDVSGWDTQNVTSMWCMFYNCSALQSLNVSGWDTGNVTNMGHMFVGCTALTDVIFGGGWGKNTAALALDLSPVGSAKSYKLTDATWASMLTMYDRKTAGLAEMTIKLSTKHNVPSGWEEQLTARGYIITKV